MKKLNIIDVYRSVNTVFTTKDISLIWEENNISILKSRIHYYVKTGKLQQIRKGIYTKDKNYNLLELANKIYTPSYISLETVLQKEGVIFQYYSTISVISYLSRCIAVGEQKFIFHKIQNKILMNIAGIIKKNTYFIATKERAFLDALYLYKDYYFDNLGSLNWGFCQKLIPIYGSKAMVKRFNSYYKLFYNA